MKFEFPHHVYLVQDNGITLHFEPGIREVPDELRGHWWLRANEVRPT